MTEINTPKLPADGSDDNTVNMTLPGLPNFLTSQTSFTATSAPVGYVRRTKIESLDDLDQEQSDEAFIFELRNQQFEMISPRDADWMTITAAADNPRLLVHVLMPEESRLRFLSLDNVRLRVLEGLMQRYQKHFGLPNAGESDGSARS